MCSPAMARVQVSTRVGADLQAGHYAFALYLPGAELTPLAVIARTRCRVQPHRARPRPARQKTISTSLTSSLEEA